MCVPSVFPSRSKAVQPIVVSTTIHTTVPSSCNTDDNLSDNLSDNLFDNLFDSLTLSLTFSLAYLRLGVISVILHAVIMEAATLVYLIVRFQ